MTQSKSQTKKQTRSLVGLVLGCTLAGMAAGVWFGRSLVVEHFADKAVDEVEVVLNADISVGSLEVHGLERVVLSNVVLRTRDAGADERELLAVPEVDVRFESLGLFSGRVRLKHVTISEPHITLIRRRDGRDNFAAIADKLRDLLKANTAVGVGGEATGLWKYVERRFPATRIVDGTVMVKDNSPEHSLIPSELPPSLEMTGLTLEASNVATLAEELELEITTQAHLPLVKSRAIASLNYDHHKHRLTLHVKLADPFELKLGDETLSADSMAWNMGGQIRLTNVKLGNTFDAGEMAVSFRESKASIRVALSDDPALALAQRVRKLVLVRPTFRPQANDRIGRKLRSLLTSNVGAAAPRPETPKPEKRARDGRPRLKKKGAKVRNAVTSSFASLRRHTENMAAALSRFATEFPLPEVEIAGGAIQLAKEETRIPRILSDLGRFDLSVKKEAEHVQFVVTMDSPDGQRKQLNRLEARIQPLTGDIQLLFKMPRLALSRFKDALPGFIKLRPNTVINDADVRVVYSPDSERMDVHGKVYLSRLALDLPILSSDVIADVDLGSELNATVMLDSGHLTIEDSKILLGESSADFQLEVKDLNAEPMLSWKFDLPRVSAQTVVESVPSAFLGKLDGLKLGGDLSWKFSGKLDMRDMRSFDYQSDARNWDFELLDLGKYIDFTMLNKPFTHRIQEGGNAVQELLRGPGSASWVKAAAVSPFMEKVLTTTEDGTFWRHKGTAWFAIKDAVIRNLQTGRFARGGSTLTMQLAKNVFLIREKTLSRKAQELFLAWQLEKYLTKRRILELYLNIVELGPKIYGIKRAAQYYFGKKPSQLNVVDCAFLASLLPNPRRYHKQFARGRVTGGWRQGLKQTIDVMVKRSKITEAERDAAAPYSPNFRKRKKR